MSAIYYINNGYLNFGNKSVFEDISFYIYPNDKICLVGRNGSGKSSILKTIAGIYEIDEGRVFKNSQVKVEYLRQDIMIDYNIIAIDYILNQLDNPDEYLYEINMIFDKLKIPKELDLSKSSGGQVKKLLLASCLIKKPDLLLLDEPTNHLDIDAIEWLENYINNYSGAVICISHDKKFQENISNITWWIDRGILRKSDLGFKHYEQWQHKIILEEEKTIKKIHQKLLTEKHWLNGGISARRKRNQKRLRDLQKLRTSLISKQNMLKNAKLKLNLSIKDHEFKSKLLIEMLNASYSYGNKEIIKNFSLNIIKGDKIGIIGPNGSGKSSLLKLLIQEIPPFSGSINCYTNLVISYCDQYRSNINMNKTVSENLCSTGNNYLLINGKEIHVISYIKKFMFSPSILHSKASILSGGELNRLALAKTLINPGNLLILDEPTNDLDIDTLEILLEILSDYKGSLIIVTHDRDFLDRLVTKTLVFQQDHIVEVIGGYQEYIKYYTQNFGNILTTKQQSKNNTQNIKNVNNQKKSNFKLSYKYQRLIKILPEEINKLEIFISELENQLDDQNLYLDNGAKFYDIVNKLENSKQELEEKLSELIKIESLIT
ncbi:ABC-F family ATP-binding cassette domain-containing protein [Rickettsia endosymbiont of Cardiosporidium cionae]|uniref:ABC-F family ATP-binding cassette domain-containing protein n=1 Tax=Rickettsia endosymbiont of Cardiosporidium cionae TaxID=2777155 RepID=UPI0018947356|nr:ABC-F family ATP-binding cassette domain-containing protein [Rickettsia endosymbiont of Cardiosporidium cionae]KAF8818881.1 ABC transporter ATP-binding protein [Rickettsia endosymbiont of Cardiosporidium cionae]